VGPAAERHQARCRERGVVDRRLIVSLEPLEQPARSDPGVALRLLEGDQRRELEEIDERRLGDLGAQSRLGDGEIAALDRPFEDRPRMTLRSDPASSPGPDGTPTLALRGTELSSSQLDSRALAAQRRAANGQARWM
jgi:hypothetical protein